ncbi:unnamed protein product [Ambrosiozyma monospora]|uniref:Unnamed protein product n=1 Tax=Ambrosiozyma monospora TaxID=43982 RepID=A0ACB5T465_AMBMO|nr:unnamed protein product [Ambrosiozyma monospora]
MDGQLSSKIVGGDSNKTFTSQLSKVRVERIIVVGYDKLPKSVKVEQDGENWEAEVLRNGTETVIRNPSVVINKDWVISFN